MIFDVHSNLNHAVTPWWISDKQLLKGFWRPMQVIKQERISAAIRLWFFLHTYVLVHSLPVNHAVLQEPLCAMASASQLSIPPCSTLPLSHSPRALSNVSEISFVSGHSTQCRGRCNDPNCQAELQEGETIYFLLLSDLRENSQRYWPFSITRGRGFCVRLAVGGRYKKSLLSLKGMALKGTAWIHCVNAILNFYVLPTLVSPTKSSNKEITFTSCWPWHCLEGREMCPDVRNLSCNLSIWVWIKCPVGPAVGGESWTVVPSGEIPA